MFIGEKQKMNNEQKYPLDKAVVYIIAFAFVAIMFLLVLYAKNISFHPVIDKAMELQKNNQIDDVSFYAVYDLFNKQFSLLLTVMGAFVSIFGVAVPLAIAFLQQKSGDMKQKQLNELQEKLEIQEKKNNEFFEKMEQQEKQYIDSLKDQKQKIQQSVEILEKRMYASLFCSNACTFAKLFSLKLGNYLMLKSSIQSCCDAIKYQENNQSIEFIANTAADYLKDYAKKASLPFDDWILEEFNDIKYTIKQSKFSEDIKKEIRGKIDTAIEIINKRTKETKQ